MTSRTLECPHCKHQFNVFAHSTSSEDWLRRRNEEYKTLVADTYICPSCYADVSGTNAATKPPTTLNLQTEKGEYIKTLLLQAANDVQAMIDEIQNAPPFRKQEHTLITLSDIANSAVAKLTELQAQLGPPQKKEQKVRRD